MFMLAPASLAVEKEKIKVACIGNSITFGAGLSNQARDSYPAVLG
jgi:sialate O-acetylesterase